MVCRCGHRGYTWARLHLLSCLVSICNVHKQWSTSVAYTVKRYHCSHEQNISKTVNSWARYDFRRNYSLMSNDTLSCPTHYHASVTKQNKGWYLGVIEQHVLQWLKKPVLTYTITVLDCGGFGEYRHIAYLSVDCKLRCQWVLWHTVVYWGVYVGIRRIPTSGFFWQRILTSVIINKQGTFRPFATPLCVYPSPFLAIHHWWHIL